MEQAISEQIAQRQVALQAHRERKKSVEDLLETYKPQIALALPRLLTPERMMRTVMTALSKRPELLECTPASLISCVLTCAQLGLMPDDILGEAYLLPFNNTNRGQKECNLIVGYKGLITLGMRSGQIKSIMAYPVFAANKEGGDKFKYSLGLNEVLEHEPSGDLTDPMHITHVYAIVKYNNGGHIFKVMTRKQIERVRDESKNYKNARDRNKTPWVTSFEEMALKTVLRRLLKMAPLSPELQKAIGLDEAADLGRQNLAVETMHLLPDMADNIQHDLLSEEEAEQRNKLEEGKKAAAEKGNKIAEAASNAIQKKGSQKVQPKG